LRGKENKEGGEIHETGPRRDSDHYTRHRSGDKDTGRRTQEKHRGMGVKNKKTLHKLRGPGGKSQSELAHNAKTKNPAKPGF